MISWQLISYKLLLLCRLIQIPFLNGYRPLDEYGRLVEIYLTLPWRNAEFVSVNATVIRTQVFPILTGESSSILFTMLRLYSKTHPLSASIFSSISPFLIVRIFSFSASLLIDYFVFRIAKHWRIKPNLVLFLYASSYVPWVFFTFSRSCLVESILFCLFLYFVIVSISFSSENDHGRPSLQAITHGNHQGHRHGHSHSHGLCSGNHDDEEDSSKNLSKRAFVLGFIFACGLSNRLNFAVLALAPLVQWFLSNSSRGGGVCGCFVRKLCNFILGLIFGLLIISLIDSLATGSLQVDSFKSLDQMLYPRTDLSDLIIPAHFFDLVSKNFTFAAWNSLGVLLTFRSLANQSIHPWYTHIFINTPLIFGVFGFCAFLYFIQCFRWEVLVRLHYINARYWFLLSAFIVPLISLSIYPNKNAEDLCPLLIPLILVVVIRMSQYSVRQQARLVSAWCAWNCFALLYYGLLYNGALYQCLSDLENARVEIQSQGADNRTFAYHFFATDQLPSISWFSSDIGVRNRLDFTMPKIFSYQRTETAKFQRRLKYTRSKFTDVYVIVPSTINVCDLWLNDFENFTLLRKYSWHFSPDAPPNLWLLFGCSPGADGFGSNGNGMDGDCRVPCFENKRKQLYQLLSLRVYHYRSVGGGNS